MRSVKPEFWADEDLAADLSRDARLLYIGLWNLADEHARLRGDPRYIKGQLLPYDDDLDAKAIDVLLDEIARSKRAHRYQVKGRSYLFLPKLAKHQRLDTDKVPSRLPGPDEADSDPDSSGSRPDESAPDPDESALKHVAGGMEHVAGGRESARAHDDEPEPEPPQQVQRPDGLTSIPDDFGPTDSMRRWAIATFGDGLDLDFETAQFAAHYRSTGARRKSWPDQWQKWVRDSAKRRADQALRTDARASPKPSTTDQRMAQAQALKAKFRSDQPGGPTISGEVLR